MNVNWIGHILHRNCLMKYVIVGRIEGKTQVTVRRGRRSTQILNDVK